MATVARKSLLWTLATVAAVFLCIAQLDVVGVLAAACSGFSLSSSPISPTSGGTVTYTLSSANITTRAATVTWSPSTGESRASYTDPQALGCVPSGNGYTCGGSSSSSHLGTVLTIVAQLASSVIGGHTSGTFTVSGNQSGTACSGSYSTSMTVVAPSPTLTISPSSFNWHAGVPVNDTVTSNGVAPVLYSVTGSLPTGLAMSSSGVITGTPSLGNYVFTINASDAASTNGSQRYDMTIRIGALPAVLPPFVPGAFYDVQLTGAGGTPPYTCRLQSGALPSWVTLTTACRLFGTPPLTPASVAASSAAAPRGQAAMSAGTRGHVSLPLDAGGNFSIEITDGNNNTSTLTYSLLSGTSVPALPPVVVVLFGLTLVAVGYALLRRRTA